MTSRKVCVSSSLAICLAAAFAAPVAAQDGWARLSSKFGDLPTPWYGRQQTASLTADLNKDGTEDIILTERTGSPSMIWLRRTKTGWDRFVIEFPQLRIEAGGTAWDIDGDGDLDLVFGGDSGSSELWWWENPYPDFDPDTGWTRRTIKKSGGRKHHDQLFGDFDGDGKGELVSWNQMAHKLLLARIPANPTEDVPWPLFEIFSWSEGEMEGLAGCDVNGDGKLDIVGGGRWFEHASANTFREHLVDDAQRFSRAACGQFRKGGWSEIAFVVGDGIGRLKMYEYVGGSWNATDLLGHDVVHGHTLRTGDIDRDGSIDILCGEMGKWIHPLPYPANPHPRVWIFYGDGKGGFEKRLISRSLGIHEGRLADVDGDGDLDIIHKPYNHDTPRIDVLINSGRPRSMARPLTLDSWKRHVIDDNKPWRAIYLDAADLDGDGRRDIVAGGWWYRNPGNVAEKWKRTMFGTPFHNFATLVDVDNDGLLDLAGTQGKASQANPRFVWARNRGNGTFTIYTNLPAAEGDFLQGVVSVQVAPGPLASIALSWHKAGQGIQLLAPPRPPANPAVELWTWNRLLPDSQDEDLTAGDIDRDGDQDLLLGTWWLRNDKGTWAKFVLNPTSGDPDRNRLGDIDNDGRLDAIVGFEAINKPGKLAWYQQPADPTTAWTEHVIADVVGPMSLDVADMDGDGDLDVIVGEHNYEKPETAALWIFENLEGTGKSWKKHQASIGDEHHDGAKAVDIDDDGDIDIISFGWSHPRVLVYENQAIDPKRTGLR
jgi:hypothetical protein